MRWPWCPDCLAIPQSECEECNAGSDHFQCHQIPDFGHMLLVVFPPMISLLGYLEYISTVFVPSSAHWSSCKEWRSLKPFVMEVE